MRLPLWAIGIGLAAAIVQSAWAASGSKTDSKPPATSSGSHIEVTADQSLEWYQDQRLYVARGNAKAVRGDLTVEGDVLTAHERDEPAKPGSAGAKSNATAQNHTPPEPQPLSATAPSPSGKSAKTNSDSGTGTGDIDKMTAEGNVRITTTKSHITGDHGVYDVDKHVSYVTGNNLKYQTAEEVVTAKDSLEYWEDKKIAVARGNAVAVRGDRHVEGDVLTAEFRDLPSGKSQLHIVTAEGHVVVITANDVSRGNHAVYDINRNIAILTGNVRITRADGTQLTGDVGEVDFAANQSRLLNESAHRVRALLPSKEKQKPDVNQSAKPVTVQTGSQTASTTP
jgi:lipopolysaccharide export system protein LptA